MKPVTLLLAVCLAGCTSVGVHVDQDQMAAFKKNETTYREVIASLGEPTSTTLMGDGGRVISYTYSQASAKPSSFIPVIGPLVGGVDVKTSSATLRFDASGVLRDYVSSEGGQALQNGPFSTGTPSARVENQPRQAGE